ncbi:MAG TPA: hypothetical protein VF037_01455 [Gemmatimonadales bacterium]
MRLMTNPADRAMLRTAIEELQKECEAARKKCDRLGVATMPIQIIEGHAEVVLKAIDVSEKDDRNDVGMQASVIPSVRLALHLHLEGLDKVRTKQVDLGILAPKDTEAEMDRARRLHEELADQYAMAPA